MLSTSTERTGQVQLLAAYERLFATAQAFLRPPACNVAERLGDRARARPRPSLAGQADEPPWATLTLNRRLAMGESDCGCGGKRGRPLIPV